MADANTASARRQEQAPAPAGSLSDWRAPTLLFRKERAPARARQAHGIAMHGGGQADTGSLSSLWGAGSIVPRFVGGDRGLPRRGAHGPTRCRSPRRASALIERAGG